MSRFTDEEMNKFVTLYRHHVCLWNSSISEYKNKTLRNNAIENLVYEMGMDDFGVNECKNKIKNVRSHYLQEVKKIISSQKKKMKLYKPRLSWFDTLDSFLRPYVQSPYLEAQNQFQPNAFDEYDTCEDTALSTSVDQEDQEQKVEDDQEESYTNYIKLEAVEPEDIVEDSSPPAKKQRTENGDSTPVRTDSFFLSTNDLNDAMADRSERQFTEFDAFGKSVAAQLNATPLEDALHLQLQIQQLITQYRLNLHRTKIQND